jgi:adenylate cyclase
MHAILGEIDQAIDLLEKVLPHSSSEQISWHRTDSDLNSVRNHPRYRKLLETMRGDGVPAA